MGAGGDAQGDKPARRRWAMLIQRVYQVDPLVCPKCGGLMKIIAFIEARQGDVIRKILEHCGLWREPPPRPPPGPPRRMRRGRARRWQGQGIGTFQRSGSRPRFSGAPATGRNRPSR